jgi:hypothetical protein
MLLFPIFGKSSFGNEISNKDNCHRPRNSDLQLPTFCFIHKFIFLTLFPRPKTQTIREDELKILFAIVNKQKISPVVPMMHQWLEGFGPIKGDIECTSLVFRITNRLGLANNCIVSHIFEPHSIMDLDFFRQARILKKTNNKIFMRYHDMITEISLPNPGLKIYAVRDYLVGLQPLPLNKRSTSARLVNAPPMHYYGADPRPEGPGYTAYTDQLGTSRQHHPWAPSPSHHSSGSSQAYSEEGHRRS